MREIFTCWWYSRAGRWTFCSGLSWRTHQRQRGGCCWLWLLPLAWHTAGWCCAPRAAEGGFHGGGRNGGSPWLCEQHLQDAGVWRCSSAEVEWLPLRRDSLREESVPFPAHYWHTPRANCLKCINGSTEECFIIEVIAVFSRLTFVSGVDWNHGWLSYLRGKFYLSQASDIHERSRCW